MPLRKIGDASLEGLTAAGEYEAAGAQLKGDAWICGRTTMQQHFAGPEPFARLRVYRPGHRVPVEYLANLRSNGISYIQE